METWQCNSWGCKESDHPEVRPEDREPLADREGESTLLSQSGEEKGSDEVVPGTSVFPLSESGMSRNFWGRIKGAKYRFREVP